MSVKVIKGGVRHARPYRFPPRANAAGEQNWHEGDPAELQRLLADGFQQGIEKGYQEGLLQGQEAGQREGFALGREEGLRQGREEGRVLGRQAFDAAAQPLATIAQQLSGFMQELERKRREQLLELVKKVSQQVIRCELTLHPTQLLSLAEEALAALPGEQSGVQVLLNPEEYQRIKDLQPERVGQWRLVPDERLALGECRVVTEQAEADIGCQQRLDACVETLAEHLQLAAD